MAASPPIPNSLLYSTIQQRKRNGEILYDEIFNWKMKHAPSEIHRFCDISVDEQVRKVLNSWIRDVDDRSSCQALQILFSFSVPCQQALDHILNLKVPIISAGKWLLGVSSPRARCRHYSLRSEHGVSTSHEIHRHNGK